MIKTIESILISDLDNNDDNWKEIDIIPASGHIQQTIVSKTGGRLRTVTVDFKAMRLLPMMRRPNISLIILTDDGTKYTVGSTDLPAALEITEGHTIDVSCKWDRPDII